MNATKDQFCETFFNPRVNSGGNGYSGYPLNSRILRLVSFSVTFGIYLFMIALSFPKIYHLHITKPLYYAKEFVESYAYYATKKTTAIYYIKYNIAY